MANVKDRKSDGREVAVDSNTLSQLVVMSFFYALGRRTYAVSEAASYVRRFAVHIEPWQREQMANDIDCAIRAGDAGDRCDIDVWQELAWFLRQSIESIETV